MQYPDHPKCQTKEYFHGFDYLRTLFVLCVVAIHTKLFSSYTPLFTKVSYSLKDISIFDIIHFNLLFSAVPGFLIISVYLSSNKVYSHKKDYIRKIEGLLYLYLFWVGILVISMGLKPSLSIAGITGFIIRGGNSLFYFFFTLIFITIISFFFDKINRYLFYFLFFCSILSLWLYPILNIVSEKFKYLVAYWNPLLFLPYAFIGKIFSENIKENQDKDRVSKSTIVLLLLTFVISAVFEWAYLPNENHKLVLSSIMPSYARLSPAIGAVLLLIFAFKINKPAPVFIKILSDASLGVYCVHIFVLRYLNPILPSWPPGKFFATLLFSLFLTFILRRILSARLI